MLGMDLCSVGVEPPATHMLWSLGLGQCHSLFFRLRKWTVRLAVGLCWNTL